jgi:succinoglycan biosynthesis protein ExoA
VHAFPEMPGPVVPIPGVSPPALPFAVEVAPDAERDPLRVSVVMPIYNEAAWIDRTLSSVLAQDYPAELTEILIADCRSEDGTRDHILAAMEAHPGRGIVLLDSADRTPGAALNLMIANAAGDIVVRVDGHAEIAPDYVRRCVEALRTSDALNVGGCVSASGRGFVGCAIAIAIGSFFGNGGARYRSAPPTGPAYVDTVQFGAWRRQTLIDLGPFVASWTVNEDCEFNARIRHAGGRILLHPAIHAVYHPRSSLRALAKQYYCYGRLKCRVAMRHPGQIRARQIAPLLLVLGLLAHVPAALLSETAVAALLAGPVASGSALGLASVVLAARRRQILYASVLPAVFATLHLSYGMGALVGLLQTASSLATRRMRRDQTGLTRGARAAAIVARDSGRRLVQ